MLMSLSLEDSALPSNLLIVLMNIKLCLASIKDWLLCNSFTFSKGKTEVNPTDDI